MLTPTEKPTYRKLCDDCWQVLSWIRNHAWAAPSVSFKALDQRNPRARISDLRILFGIEIEADSHTDPVTFKKHTIYRIPKSSRPRAEWLWQHQTLQGYVGNLRQKEMF